MNRYNEGESESEDESEIDDRRVMSRITLIFAIVVLAAIAFVIILMGQ